LRTVQQFFSYEIKKMKESGFVLMIAVSHIPRATKNQRGQSKERGENEKVPGCFAQAQGGSGAGKKLKRLMDGGYTRKQAEKFLNNTDM